jgi:hypothetical protein
VSIKTQIIITFSVLTAILVTIMSRVGYYSVREIYMDQLSEQTDLLTRLIATDLNPKYLSFLGSPGEDNPAASYYEEAIRLQSENMFLSNIFIFDADLEILVQSSVDESSGNSDPRLLLNRTEIFALQVGESTTSLPFKGRDGQWYLWGFYRLDETYWLGIRENAARLARVEALSSTFWLIGIAGILVTVLFGWLLARTITGSGKPCWRKLPTKSAIPWEASNCWRDW